MEDQFLLTDDKQQLPQPQVASANSTRKGCLDRRRESSRYAARDRRGKEADIFVDLKEVVPIVDEAAAATHVDRIALLRVASTLCRMRRCAGNFLRRFESSPTPSDDIVELSNGVPSPETRRRHDADVWTEECLAECLDGFALLTDVDGTILYVTESVNFFIGLTQTDLVGRHLKEFVHVTDYDELSRAILAAERGSEDGKALLETVLRMKTVISPRGRTLNLKSALYKAIMCRCVFIASGSSGDENVASAAAGRRLTLLYGTSAPAGQGTLLNGALKSNEASSRIFSTRHTCDMRFTYVSDNLNLLLRHSSRSLMGTSLYELVHAADLSPLAAAMTELFCKGYTMTPYYRLLGANSSVIWCQTEATTVTHTTRGQKGQYVLCMHTVLGTQSELESWNTAESLLTAGHADTAVEVCATGEFIAGQPVKNSVKLEIPDVAEYFGRQPEFVDCTDFTPLIEPSAAVLGLSDFNDFRVASGPRYIRPVQTQPTLNYQVPPPQQQPSLQQPQPVVSTNTNAAKLPRNNSFDDVLQWLFQDEDFAGLPPAPAQSSHHSQLQQQQRKQQQPFYNDSRTLSQSLDGLDAAIYTPIDAMEEHSVASIRGGASNGAVRATCMAPAATAAGGHDASASGFKPLQLSAEEPTRVSASYRRQSSQQQHQHQPQQQSQQLFESVDRFGRGRSVDGVSDGGYDRADVYGTSQQQQQRFSRYERYNNNNNTRTANEQQQQHQREQQQKSQSIDSYRQQQQLFNNYTYQSQHQQQHEEQRIVVLRPGSYRISAVSEPEGHVVPVNVDAGPTLHGAVPFAYCNTSYRAQLQQQQNSRLRNHSRQQFFSYSPAARLQQQQQMYQSQFADRSNYQQQQTRQKPQLFQSNEQQQIRSCSMTLLNNNNNDNNNNKDYSNLSYRMDACCRNAAYDVAVGEERVAPLNVNTLTAITSLARTTPALALSSSQPYETLNDVRSTTSAMSLDDFGDILADDTILTPTNTITSAKQQSRPVSECDTLMLYCSMDDKEFTECEQLGAGLAPFLPQEDMQELLDGGDGVNPFGKDVEEFSRLFPDFDPSDFRPAKAQGIREVNLPFSELQPLHENPPQYSQQQQPQEQQSIQGVQKPPYNFDHSAQKVPHPAWFGNAPTVLPPAAKRARLIDCVYDGSSESFF